MRIPANALSRALVGCLAACAYALHQRSLLRAERIVRPQANSMAAAAERARSNVASG